jgi:hypothetical protein
VSFGQGMWRFDDVAKAYLYLGFKPRARMLGTPDLFEVEGRVPKNLLFFPVLINFTRAACNWKSPFSLEAQL